MSLTALRGRRRRRLAAAVAVLVMVAVGEVPAAREGVGHATESAIQDAFAAAPVTPPSTWTDGLPRRSTMVAADGSPIATFWWQDRQPVPVSQVSPDMRQAIVAVEDSGFYQHPALALRSVARAALADSISGQAEQGASTIDEQFAKNLLLIQGELDQNPVEEHSATAKVWSRKVDDLHLAAYLDAHLTKDGILGGYLNAIYYGNGAYGVQSAAQRYFSTTAAALTLGQAALLAGIVQSPTLDDPVAHPDAARARRNEVLTRMHQLGEITSADLRTATAAPLALVPSTPRQGCAASPYPRFCQAALSQVMTGTALGGDTAARSQAWRRGGLVITTTLQPRVQRAATAAMVTHAPATRRSSRRDAVAAIEPGTGRVLAIAQDSAYGHGAGQTYVDYATNRDLGGSSGFQGGSTFKAFTLAAAFEEGMTPNSVINAPPSRTTYTARDFTGCAPVAMTPWSPTNAPGEPTGPMTLATATAHSVNTAFVSLEGRVGICHVAAVAAALGVTQADGSPLPQVPALTLGASTVSPLTMAAAYAAFAAGGRWCAPSFLATVTGADGHRWSAPPACRQAIPAQVARKVTVALRAVVTRGTGTAADIGRPVAGKTGTSDTSASTWFVGYTPQFSAAVWVGDPLHPNARVARAYGADIAAPTWASFARAALAGTPVHRLAGQAP